MKKPPLTRIKTGKWERQWAMTKASVNAGGTTAGKMWGNAFLNKTQRESRNKQVLSEQAQYLAYELGKLKGSVVKVGQMMALYGEHILPAEVSEAFRSLEEDTQSLNYASIEAVIAEQLGDKINDFSIDPEPIGAASLAQVHKALHKPSGAVYCLKVQYPGVKEAIDSDMAAVIRVLKISRLLTASEQLDQWLVDLKEVLYREVDYVLEAQTTTHFAKLLGPHSIFSVPKVYSEYCTSSLLALSFEPGVAVNHPSIAAISLARKNRLAEAFLQLFFDELLRWHFMQTDPNFGNYRVLLDEVHGDRIVLLDFGSVQSFDDSFVTPVKTMIAGALQQDIEQLIEGAIGLGLMQASYPEEVHRDFAELCYLLVEPFTYTQNSPGDCSYVSAEGNYCWAQSKLPKRAGKHAAKSALSQYFAIPPKEFALLSRKLLGVYAFISALGAEFDASALAADYFLHNRADK